MPSYYTIVQFFPDPARRERINIGVIAFGDGQVRSLFLNNWTRVKQFAGKDIEFLKDFGRDARHFDEPTLRASSEGWLNTIQFTKPAASLLSVDELLSDMAPLYLVEEDAARRGYRVKSDVVRLVRTRIREELVGRLGGVVGRSYLKPENYSLRGFHKAYQCDVSVGNGQPIFAAQAISFEVPREKNLDKDISAAAWIVQDIKQMNASLPIGVIVLPPRQRSDAYNDAKGIFTEKGAEVVEEPNLPNWVNRMVDLIPARQSA